METKKKKYIQDCCPTDMWIEEGFKVGIREVVECIREYGVGYALSEAKLKEWGIE